MPNKSDKKKAKIPTDHTLVIAFSDFQNGHKHVIAGCVSAMTRERTDKQDRRHKSKTVTNAFGYDPKKSSSYTFRKAADIQVDSRHKVALTEARIEAVSRFLKKAKNIDTIKIYTDDPSLLSHLMPAQLKEQLNELKDKFAKFSIVPASADQENAMALVQRAIAFKINDLSKNNKESKGYVDRHIMTASR